MKQSGKIILADTTLGHIHGGAQTFLAKLAAGLNKIGWSVTILSEVKPPSDFLTLIKSEKINLVSDLWRTPFLMESLRKPLSEWLNQQAPCSFVISASSGAAWVPLPLLKSSVKTVAISHSDAETFYLPIRHYSQFLDAAIGVSQEICRRFVSECKVPFDRVHYVPYGVKTASEEEAQAVFQQSTNGPLRIIFVGRLEQPAKRVWDVVAVAKKLFVEKIDFVLDVIGDGAEASEMKAALAREMSAGFVCFRGWLPEESVIQRLRKSEVFLLTSDFEGLPIALLEAMGNCVLPIVTDLASGNRELISDRQNGYLVSVGDIDRFTAVIRDCFQHRSRLLEMRRVAWESGQVFSVERMVQRYSQLIGQLMFSDASHSRPDPVLNYPMMETCRSKYPFWMRRLKVSSQRLFSAAFRSLMV